MILIFFGLIFRAGLSRAFGSIALNFYFGITTFFGELEKLIGSLSSSSFFG